MQKDSSVSQQSVMRGRRYRLQLTNAQEVRLDQWSGGLRALWNAALEQRKTAWRNCGMSVGLSEQCRDLTEARAVTPWLKDIPAQVAQSTLRDLDQAYSRFFMKLAAYPHWRSKRKQPGLRFPQHVEVRRLNRRWGEVRLTKLGWVRFRWTRPLGGTIKHATIVRDALDWHVSFCVEIEHQSVPLSSGSAVGVDCGVVALVATSDGELIASGFWKHGEQRRRRALEQHLARQRLGSNRRRVTVQRLGKLRARVARRRRHQLHKLSYQLATSHGLIAIEQLNVRAMTTSARGTIHEPGVKVRQKAGLNREILEQGWGELHRQLAYKAAWYDSELYKVSAAYSSQTCAECGVVDSRSRESQARFCCINCGHQANADVNAARVILQRALTLSEGRSVAARGDLGVAQSEKREYSRQKAKT